MTWQISNLVDLRNDRVSDIDADRQQRTATEILRRLNDQPGVVLADEVGMGKRTSASPSPCPSWRPPNASDPW
jgi:hypothetical protein